MATKCCCSWSPIRVAADAGARVGVEVAARCGAGFTARCGAEVGARGGAVRSAADGGGRDATEVGARVVTGLDVHDPAVGRALMAPPSALSASVLTGAVVRQRSILELITTPASCVRLARTSLGGWLVHCVTRRYWAAVGDGTGAGAGVGVDAVVGAGVGIGCTAASSTMAGRVEYDSQRCRL